MRARVIGMGQASAGDDGVGLAVLARLREGGVPDGVELHEAAEPGELVWLLASGTPTLLVDAVLGSPAGEVVEIAPEDLAAGVALRVSSHGLGIAEAVSLARVLRGEGPPPTIQIVAITIARPERGRHDLSPEVAAAVPRAAARLLALLKVERA